ncbi:hypothetical protein EVAR_100109_1 [Eumeta japonica]|uniref:Uncharacterized protein n=1 Tax=Eumeta variegata TaxID=151549 RepID=A0A4C1YSA5_EUMVA|nr:hypothetical protein EVAR_100109_1 [Eumeta japonica]
MPVQLCAGAHEHVNEHIYIWASSIAVTRCGERESGASTGSEQRRDIGVRGMSFSPGHGPSEKTARVDVYDDFRSGLEEIVTEIHDVADVADCFMR